MKITSAYLDTLRHWLKTGPLPLSLIESPTSLAREMDCPACGLRIHLGYLVEGLGYCCQFCALTCIVKELVAFIDAHGNHTQPPFVRGDGETMVWCGEVAREKAEELLRENAPVPEPATPQIPAAPKTDCVFKDVGKTVRCLAHDCLLNDCLMRDRSTREDAIAQLGQGVKFGRSEIHLQTGEKLDILNLPRGTVVHYPGREGADLSDLRNGKPDGPVSEWDAGLMRREGDPYVGPAVARKWAGVHVVDNPEFDLSTLPRDEQPLFEGYQSGRQIFKAATDTYRYEATVGTQEIRDAIDDQDRAVYGDETPEEEQARIQRTASGEATVQLRDPRRVPGGSL